MLAILLICMQDWSLISDNTWSLEQGEEVIQSTFTESSESRREAARFYVVMFSAEWCQPCQQYKQSGKLKHLQDRFPVSVVDIDEQRQWRSKVPSVPTFWLCDYDSQKKLMSWTGAVDAEIIEAEAKRRSRPRYDDGIMPVPVSYSSQQMSHSEMKALHDRLHGGGSWTWPGDLRSHLETVHGVDLGQAIKTKPVQLQSRGSSCPGNSCPQSQRRGLFGRLRR
jgi:thiol-disulfide isomerase/thioredoxin